MEQGHNLSTSSSGCAEQAARVPGHAQSCLLWGEKAISLFIYPGKTSSAKREQREVFGAAEGRLGPALKSEQGHRLLPAELQPSVRSLWGGRSSKEGAPVQQPPPRDLPSLLPLHGPGRSRAAPGHRPKVASARVQPGSSGSLTPEPHVVGHRAAPAPGASQGLAAEIR